MNILITSLGSGAALYIIKAINKTYKNTVIYGVDVNENNLHIKFVDYFYKCPRFYEEKYFQFIKELINEKNIDIIWPINTLELQLFSSKKDLIEKQYSTKVVVNEEEILKIVNNKGNVYSYLSSEIPSIIPKYKIVRCYDELIQSIYEFGYPSKKVCIKKCIGAGSKGFRIVDSSVNIEEIMFDTPGNTALANIDEIKLLKNVNFNKFPNMLVSEYLPYEEYDVDVLSYKGQVFYCIPRLNIEMYNGTSMVTKTQYNKEIIDLSKKITKIFKLDFINNIAFKYGYDGKPYLLEINPRIPATCISTLNSGVNYIELVINLIYNKPIDLNKKIRYGTTTIKYWEDVFF